MTVDLTTAVSGLIFPGTGAIARITYTIDASTVPGDFADLTPENSDIRDETAASLSVTPKAGRVGALECVNDFDCGTCEKCELASNLCVFQTTAEDVKGECASGLCSSGLCNGSGRCAYSPGTIQCRPVADVCDAAEFCTGNSADCPIDGFAPDTTECRPVGGLCDVAEFCIGNDPACPLDGFATDGTSCDDGLYCNGTDTCTGGSCSTHAGTPCLETECNTCQEATDSCFDGAGTLCTDDGNVCTDDACDGAGACAHPANTESCDDGLFCNGVDTCSGGSCFHGGSPCPETECNTCQEATDSCFDPSGTACTDDGNLCTDDTCDGGGACIHPANTAPCNDGLYCNGTDTCNGGSCSAHTGSPCLETDCNACQEATDSCFDPLGTVCADDGNECTDDECDGTGACTHPDNTDLCDDGLYCTQVDECQGGQCIGWDDPCHG